MENYILLKDLPDAKVGTVFIYTDNLYVYKNKMNEIKDYSVQLIINESEWFIKESEYKKMKSYILQSAKDKVIYGYKDKTNFYGMYLHHDKDNTELEDMLLNTIDEIPLMKYH